MEMRLKLAGLLALLVVLVAPVRADDTAAIQATLKQLPSCAVNCLFAALPGSPCGATNQTCICENKEYNANVTACVTQACSVKDALHTRNVTDTSCGRPVRDRSQTYITVNNTLVSIAGVFILQRFLYKLYARMPLGLDDWFTLLTFLVGIPSAVINSLFMTHNGVGRDIWTLTPDQITRFGLFFYIQETVYLAEVAISKLALLFFYMRIFPAANIRRLLWGTVIFNCIFGLTYTLISIFQCIPVGYFWKMWDGEHEGRCLNVSGISWSNAIISIVVDLWMIAIPLWQLRTLKLGWKKKLSVGLMFSVGLFVTIVSILRLKSLINFSYSTANPTWDFFDVGIWSDIEINVSMICVCLPSLRLMLVRLFPKLKETTQYYHDRRTDDVTRDGWPLSNRSRAERSKDPVSVSIDQTSGPNGPNAKGNHIWYQKTFDVNYADHDEAHLVSIGEHDAASAKSTKSTVSS